MIQRIQSLYLLIAAIAVGGTAFLPFATTSQTIEGSSLFADQAFNVFDNPVLYLAGGVGALLFLVAIFLFNNRKLQKRLSTLSVIVIFITLGFAGFLFYTDQSNWNEQANVDAKLGIALPVVGIILALLANRAISKDEKLVRSADRLR